MKRVLILLLVAAIMIPAVTAIAQQGTKGASATAMEKASDEAIFHRIGDWFATIGKSPEEKQAIIAERKAKRAAKRAEKEAAKQKKLMEKQMKETKEKMKGMGQ